MTADEGRLTRLKTVTALLADQALAPVAAAGARVRRSEQHAEALASHRADLMSAGADPALAGTMLAQAERLRRLHAAALQDVAKARVAFEKEKAQALASVGRDQAIGKLIEKKKNAARLEVTRRKLR